MALVDLDSLLEELILPTLPSHFAPDSELLRYYSDWRGYGEAHRASLEEELRPILTDNKQSRREVNIARTYWDRRRRQSSEEWDEIVEVGNQLAAWLVLSNHAALHGKADWSWISLLVPRTALTKLAPKLQQPRTLEKVQVCCESLLTPDDKFSFTSTAKGIVYFQNKSWWRYQEQLTPNEFTEAPPVIDSNISEDERERLAKRTRERLWHWIQESRSEKVQLQLHILICLYELRGLGWDQIANGLTEDLSDLSKIADPASLFLLKEDIPPPYSVPEALAYLSEKTLTSAALRQFYCRHTFSELK